MNVFNPTTSIYCRNRTYRCAALRGLSLRLGIASFFGFCGMIGAVSVAQPTSAVAPQSAAEWSAAHEADLVSLYRELHQQPELSFDESKTAARLAEELKALGATVTSDVGGHGVVGILENGDGPTLMLRTDLDGLPVVEQTGLVYASKVKTKDAAGQEVGVMHACGHDVHMTCFVGAARYLAEHRDQWQGRVMLIGQPAEERGAGARAMLDDGLFTRFRKPDYAVALHCDANLAAGKVGYRGGYALANVDSVDITLRGRGGHGAYPHTTIDPIVQAAELVLSLQTIVSREVAPTDPAVITVGSIHAGTKHNVISDECKLQLTVRSYSDEVRDLLLGAIKRKANATAASYEAPAPTVVVSEGTPSLFNDEALARRVGPVLERVMGAAQVGEAELSMGGEDFSRYGRAGVPIMMFRLGTVEAARLERFRQLGQSPPSLHSAQFYPDAEPTLRAGVTALVAIAQELLQADE